jgi:hypothetical protein
MACLPLAVEQEPCHFDEVDSRIEAAVRKNPCNRELAKDNPERVFDRPQQIVDETLLTRGEKIATLNRWRQTILDELSASGEGMRTHGISSDRSQLLAQIEDARAAVTKTSDD